MSGAARRGILILAGAIVAPIVIAVLLPRPGAPTVLPASLCLFVVVAAAGFGYRLAAVAAAISGALAVWFFDIPPVRTFSIENTNSALAVGSMMGVGLLCALLLGHLSTRIKEMRTHGATFEVAVANDRETLNAIQHAILPASPPTVDGVRVTTEYRMAGPSSGTLGGDFYVLVPFENGSLGIGIGDVAGHGPAAVGAMANARMTLRSVATITPDPTLAMQRTELVLRRSGALEFLTVLYGVLDPVRGSFTWVNAGHLPPIIRRADGTATLLDAPPAGILGYRSEREAFVAHHESVSPGDTLVFYTDGMVEERGIGIDVGIERLRALVSEEFDDDVRFAQRLMDSVSDEPGDDVALLVAHVGRPQPRPPTPSPRSHLYRRRPSRVRAREARDGELIETPLGTWTATQRDWVVQTTEGEQLVPGGTFHHLFVEDPDPPLTTVRRHFQCTPADVRAARAFVSEQLDGMGIDHDAAALMTGELATNAVVHARSAFDVTITTDRASVEISVTDDSPDDIRLNAPALDSSSGRGLTIVDQLADEWGTTRTAEDGKTVWFRLQRLDS